MHTHLFNARDLPLAGTISAVSLDIVGSSMAQVIAEALLQLSHPDDLNPEWETLSANKARRDPNVLTLEDDQRQSLIEFTGYQPPLGLKAKSLEEQNEFDLDLLARALQRAGFPPAHDDEPGDEKGVGAFGGPGDATVAGALKFVNIMRRSNVGLAKLLTGTYTDVDLFVHHMMDMEKAYADLPHYDFQTQMRRMPLLNARFPGKLIHFSAFDPFRRLYALDQVKLSVELGAIGVKFYPPSGYSASSNRFIGKPSLINMTGRKRWHSRYANLKPQDLDKIINEFFVYCKDTRLPIFTHCTPNGFQAHRKAGENSDPSYWEAVLEQNSELRVCFGHSGGSGYWFGGKTDSKSYIFGEKVIELCLKYPNVYCEVGYLAGILEPKARLKFATRLADVIKKPSPTGNWTFGDKIMYGTDWHMMYKVEEHERYLERLNELFLQNDTLKHYRRRFFAGNAAEFLRLATLVQKPQFAAYQRHWERIIQGALWEEKKEVSEP